MRELLEARAKETDDLKREYQAVRQARAVLETQPDDPQANETVGRYYGLLKGDWKRGLPRLAAATDPDLKKLAQDDLAQPVILDQRRALADRWWAAAEKRSGKEQDHLRKRAAKWYQLIEPNLSGTDQLDVRHRRFQAGDPDVQIDASFLPKFTGLECRREAVRPTMLRVFGGSAAGEAAVDRALEWLAGQQDTNGSWSFAHIGSRGKAKYPNPGKLDNARNAATALALLPYLGAGYGPKEGRYKTNVNNGLTFLKGRMARMVQMGGVPTFYEPEAGQMPSHPLAAIALCEASALGADPHTRKAAQAAVQVILSTQNSDGGWSSMPSPPEPAPGTSGMYPTGWNLAALRATQWAALDVDQKALQEAGRYIETMRVANLTGYRRSDNVAGRDPTATAVAMSAQMVLGRPRDDRELVDYVAALGQSGPSTSGRLYLNYYNSQVMRDCGGPTREKWNTTLRDYLIGTQEMEGDLAGSWFLPDTGWSTANGGRLFCTAVATLILEVYYRSPPLYQ